jgi:hypothetical protein
MTESDPLDWARESARLAGKIESDRSAKAKSERQSEEDRQTAIATDARNFKADCSTFLNDLSDQLQSAVNAFNSEAEAAHASQMDAPLPSVNELRIELTKRLQPVSPAEPGRGLPPKLVKTTIRIVKESRTLEVAETHSDAQKGPGKARRVEFALHEVEENILGHPLAAYKGEVRLNTSDLVREICKPLFDYTGELA